MKRFLIIIKKLSEFMGLTLLGFIGLLYFTFFEHYLIAYSEFPITKELEWHEDKNNNESYYREKNIVPITGKLTIIRNNSVRSNDVTIEREDNFNVTNFYAYHKNYSKQLLKKTKNNGTWNKNSNTIRIESMDVGTWSDSLLLFFSNKPQGSAKNISNTHVYSDGNRVPKGRIVSIHEILSYVIIISIITSFVSINIYNTFRKFSKNFSKRTLNVSAAK